ncbi:MAG: class I SAM-dependent methyltransferase [Methanobacteriaceae archaeon]|nr:class I SAM-dependent methyltransferase [Methanobacteriaceae archaeon]
MKDSENKKKRWANYNYDYAIDHQKKEPEKWWEFNEIFALYEPKKNENVLEIGCNTGEFCFLLKKKFNVDPTGIDINEDAITLAKKQYPDINFEVRNFKEVSGNYDVIYMLHLIEHLEDPLSNIIELNRLLKKNGKIIIVCPNKWAYILKFICLMQRTKFCYDPTHLFEFSPLSLKNLILSAGYKKIKIHTKPLGVPYISRFSNNLYYNFPSSFIGGHIFALVEK